jgi:RNA 2',3'-cyclic 3'-phosphodiesterase
MKRIFIALKVEPDGKFLKMISSLQSRLQGESIKWVDTDNIHITLAFLGDTEDDRISGISKMLNSRCEGSGKFEILIKGSGVFKSLKDPRVIWAGIEPSDKLNHLNGLIINGLKDTGIRIEERPFKPHITLGRIKYLSHGDALKEAVEEFRGTELQKVPVNEVILYESILLASGPVYKPIGKFIL